MWFGADMFGIYQGQSGLEQDTIEMVSYGSVLMPWYAGFDDPGLPNSAGKIYINTFNAYTVDSVYIYGFYGRNPAKTSIVDTMIISLVWGDNIRAFRYGNQQAQYGVDTIRVATVRFDQVEQAADTYSTGNPNRRIIKIPLTTATLNDTTSNGLTVIGAAFNQAIPAGDMVAASATFKTGETYTPFSDTVFRGSVNSAVPFKYGMFRPAIYGQNASQFATWTSGNWNGGIFKFMPDTANGYGGWYIPGYAFNSAESNLEFPDIDYILSCVGCNAVGVANVAQNIKSFGAHPNPANTAVTISFGLAEAKDVNVSIINAVGQTVKSKRLTNVSGGNAKFSTSDLANGVYMYTIDADGQRKTGRIVVAH